MLTLDQRLVVRDLEDRIAPSYRDKDAIYRNAAQMIRRMAAELHACKQHQAGVMLDRQEQAAQSASATGPDPHAP